MTGILLIDKAPDWTSHDVVAKLRGLLRERRIGHAGTLDPMATGLLTVFVGQATRAVQYAESDDKTYIARLQLGLTTDTQDVTGTVLTQCTAAVSEAELEAVLPRFRGEISQVPPMYSAVKVGGQRLYKLARRGETVERAPRAVTVHAITVLDRHPDGFTLEVTCSKGTYIRTLCHDIGAALGCGGALAALRRTRAGIFSVEQAVTLEAVAAEAGDRSRLLHPLDTLFSACAPLAVTAEQASRIQNGGDPAVVETAPGRYRVYDPAGRFLALGAIEPAAPGRLAIQKRFFIRDA